MKQNSHIRLALVVMLLTVMAAMSGLRAATYPQTVLTNNPAAYWRFESVNDVSLTNSYTNSFQGNATVTAPGGGVPLTGVANNRALLLDGDGDAVYTGVTNLTFSSNGTFMAWVNFAQLPSVNNRTMELIVKSHFDSPLDFLFSADRLVGYAGDYQSTYYDFNPALTTNTWYHLVFTFNNAAGFKRLYVNGILVADLPLSPNLTGSADEITIGNSAVFTDRSVNGRMDEVALFNRALTGAEIQNIFASAGVSTPIPQPAVKVNVELTREITPISQGAYEYWGVGINFQISPTPFSSTNTVYSTHTNHTSSIGGPTGDIGGGGSIYGTFAEALTEVTNGLWTVILHQGEPSQQIYRFKMTAANLTTNNFANITYTSPVDDSVGNATNVPFTWTQSSPWLLNSVDLSGPSYVTASVPPGATSWTNAPSLNQGRYYFNLRLRTNATPWISMTTPTNATGTLSNWAGSSQLFSRREIRFRVGNFIPLLPGLQTHLRFDDSNYLGLDSSSSNNNANTTWYDQAPTYNAAGKIGGAASFTQGGWLEFQDPFSQSLGKDFTVAVWVKTTQNPGDDTDGGESGAGIVGRYVGDSGNNTVPIALNGSKAGFWTRDHNSDETLHSTTSINNSGANWVHVAVTRSQATGEKRIYINGVLDSTATGVTNIFDEGDPIRVGYGNNVTYNGLLDDLQIYSANLSPSDIAYLYANPGEEITSITTLGDAVNAPQLFWTGGGNASWFVETTNTHDSVSAAQSGNIGDNNESWIQTTVTGPGNLSFWWKVSSEDGADYLEFLLDGSTQGDISGESGWLQETYPITSGSHTLRWNYYKDSSFDDGLDAGFLDQVSFVPTTPPNTNIPPVITINPFSQTNRPGYNVALLAAATSNAAITWNWYKVGNPAPISTATNALYIPATSGTAGVAGNYFAIVTNLYGSATTTVATVTFQSAALPPDWSPAFTTQYTPNASVSNATISLASLLDSTGNIYTVGSATGTNVFGTNTLISVNGKECSTFLKQTATGTPIWGRSMTNDGNGNSYPRGIATAPGDGFYAVGLFFGTNWLGTNKLTDTAGGSTYLARFDANGSNVWLRTISGTNFNFPNDHTLVSDPAGNVTLSVLISGYTSFGSTNLNAIGQQGALAQYDLNGNVRWIQLPSAWPSYLTYSAGRIYGSMGGGLTNFIGGVTNVSDRRQTLFSLNATNGQGLWVRSIAAQKDEGPSSFGSDNALVAVSGTNIFVTGTSYGSNAVFGAFTVNIPDGTGQYFARYDTNGNAQLATSFGSRFTWPWASVADASGNVYVGADFDNYSIFGSKIIAAPFYETVQFVGSVENRIPGQGFVAKFDRNGNPLWARQAQSPSSYLNLRDIILAPDGVWASGFFNPIGIFGTNTIYGGLSPYHRSGFLAKITDGVAGALPVTLLSPQKPGGNFQFQFLSQSGKTNIVQSRTNLTLGVWIDRTNILGDGGTKTVTLPVSSAPTEFFRISTQ